MANVIQDLANNPIAVDTTGQFIGYTESEETSETLSLKMYNFLLYAIRQSDSTREGAYFVKRLFQGPQDVWQTIQEKIFSIKDLWSITRCPDEALKYLKNIVGWTRELNYITDELDYDTLRRLIASSVPLWRKRGREETIIDIISLILNVRCVIWNWFDYRWIVDETEFTEHHQGYDSWIIDYGEDGLGEYSSNLRIVDDGTLDKNLVKNILKLVRACGERIEIAYINFLDRFLVNDDTSQWDNTSGTIMSVSNSIAELDVVGEYQLSTVDVENSYEWTRYVTYFRIQGTAEYGFGIVFYYQDSNNYYGIKFKISNYENYELFKIVSGVYEAIRIGKVDGGLLEDTWYGIRIHIDKDENELDIVKIYLDTNLILSTEENQIDGTVICGTSNVGKIYRSVDYGENWSEVTDTVETIIASVSTFNNGVVLAGSSSEGKIYRSVDYGENWYEVEDTTETVIYSLATFSNGVALAGSSPGGKIFRSVDYGLNWSEVEDTTGGIIYSLATFSNGVALAGYSPGGKIFRSTDYGLNWSEVEDTTESGIRSLATFSNGVALAGSVNGGKIFRSTDYGLNWSEVEDTTESGIQSLATFSNGVALAGSGNSGKIFRSTDYGENWSEVEDTTESGIQSLATFSNGIALAGGGNNGKIFRSPDYGLNWSEIEDTEEVVMYSMATIESGNLDELYKGTIGIFSENGSTMKLDECELFQLPMDLVELDINE
jgi:photosystem II stability/assembly factor-like uncharacterized protein